MNAAATASPVSTNSKVADKPKTTSPILATALAAYKAGLSVLPPNSDGSKSPIAFHKCVKPDGRTGKTWIHPDGDRFGEVEIRAWYGVLTGIGLACGSPSGGLVCFEFDCAATHEAFLAKAEECGLGEFMAMLAACYLERTPSGGVHYLYFTDEMEGSTKLAKKPAPTPQDSRAKKTLIETKGEGGYVIIAPTHGKVHPSGKPYELVSGSIETIPTISAAEQDAMWKLAMTFDQCEPVVFSGSSATKAKPAKEGEVRPGDDFNARAHWMNDILGPAGWKANSRSGDILYVTRPGKSHGISASINATGADNLFVFTTGSDFEEWTHYTKFGAYTLLNHRGDFTESTKELSAMGYGTRPKRVEPDPLVEESGGQDSPAESGGDAGVAEAAVDAADNTRQDATDGPESEADHQTSEQKNGEPPDLKTQVLGAVEQGGWANLYESSGLLMGLAKLELLRSDKFAGILASLRGIRGFSAGDFKAAMAGYRKAVNDAARKDQSSATTSYKPRVQYNDHGTSISIDVEADGRTQREFVAMFSAKIVSDSIRDDGTPNPERRFRVLASAANGVGCKTVDVNAEDFDSMSWATKLLGPSYKIVVGRDNKAHTAYGIKHFSGDVPETRTYVTIGWRQVGDDKTYIHGGGGIQAAGNNSEIAVDLTDGLPVTESKKPGRFYRLPDPPTGDELTRAIRASLGILRLGENDRPNARALAAALFCFTMRAPIGPAGFVLQIFGDSGCLKSSVSALSQQHWGREMIPENFPASHEVDSATSILELIGELPHSIVVTDDFIPRGTRNEIENKHRELAKLFQSIGNRKGRSRAGIQGGVNGSRPPLCSVISTGEDRVKYGSADARSFAVRVIAHPDDQNSTQVGTIDKKTLELCQEDADSGLYACSMSGYIQWLAGRIDEIQAGIGDRVIFHRDRVSRAGLHNRTPKNVAEMCVGAETFLRFAVEKGAIAPAESDDYNAKIQAWLAEGVDEIHADQADSTDTGKVFLKLLESILASGRAYLSSKGNGDVPDGLESKAGWQQELKWQGNDLGQLPMWVPPKQGKPIGWIDGKFIYLDPSNAFAAILAYSQEVGEPFATSHKQTFKVLIDTGRITKEFQVDKDKKEKRDTSRVYIGAIKAQKNVFPIPIEILWQSGDGPAETAVEGEI